MFVVHACVLMLVIKPLWSSECLDILCSGRSYANGWGMMYLENGLMHSRERHHPLVSGMSTRALSLKGDQ